jgi:hypothetical protein
VNFQWQGLSTRDKVEGTLPVPLTSYSSSLGPNDSLPLSMILGSSKKYIRAFPAEARAEAGKQLRRVQRGLDPVDWKPMATIGAGVREVRVNENA